MHYKETLMRVFLDTNVIIDLIQRRVGYDDAALILQKAENGEYSLFTSSLSMVNVAYILRKYYNGESLYHLLEELGDIGRILYQQRLFKHSRNYMEKKWRDHLKSIR